MAKHCEALRLLGLALLCVLGAAARAEPTTVVVSPAWTARLPEDGDILALAFSDDGKSFASISADGVVRRYDVATRTERAGALKAGVRTTAAALCGDAVAALGRSAEGPWRDIQLWDIGTGKQRRGLSSHRDLISALSFDASGQRLLSGGEGGEVKLWAADQGRVLHVLSTKRAPISAVALASDGRVAVAGTRTGKLRVWDARRGTLLRETKAHKNAVVGLTIAVDGQRLLSGDDDSAVLWRMADGAHLRTLETDGHLSMVALSPTGAFAAIAGRTLRLWDLGTGQITRTLVTPGPLGALAISSDGRRVIGGSGLLLYFWEL